MQNQLTENKSSTEAVDTQSTGQSVVSASKNIPSWSALENKFDELLESRYQRNRIRECSSIVVPMWVFVLAIGSVFGGILPPIGVVSWIALASIVSIGVGTIVIQTTEFTRLYLSLIVGITNGMIVGTFISLMSTVMLFGTPEMSFIGVISTVAVVAGMLLGGLFMTGMNFIVATVGSCVHERVRRALSF